MIPKGRCIPAFLFVLILALNLESADEQFGPAKLLAEQKLAEASAQRDNTKWTLCLINLAKLRLIYQNAESAIEFLKSQPWPDEFKYSSILNLYKARLLIAHNRIDIYRKWPRDQVDQEIQEALKNAWQVRGQLGEWPNALWRDIDSKDYPYAIRSTLRDSVSYMWVEFLLESRNKKDILNRSDLEKLVSGDMGEVSLIDPKALPLEKACFILSDLENWHAQRNEKGSALEARLERYRILHENCWEEEDRDYIRNDLQKHLMPVADSDWWAEGMAQLADFLRSGKEQDSLIRARKIALRGEAAHIGLVGRRHCTAVRKKIEEPDYALSGMQTDNPGKKSLLVMHKNLEKIYFRAYPIDLLQRIKAAGNEPYEPSDEELKRLILKRSPSFAWEADLPDVPDYQMHKTFVSPPMTKPGVYLVTASARKNFLPNGNKLLSLFMTIGNLALIYHKEAGQLTVTVLAGNTGKPIVGAEVILHQYGDQHWNESKLSDKTGVAQFFFNGKAWRFCLIARRNGHIAYDVDDTDYYDEEQKQSTKYSAIVYTDRSVYDPDQKMSWKAVLYKRLPNGTPLETAPGASLTISLLDPQHKVVESRTVTTNSFGSVSGGFVIPSGRGAGTWYLSSSLDVHANFEVRGRVGPVIEGKILDPAEPMVLDKPVRIRGYFGPAVSKGKVQWSVKYQPGAYGSPLYDDFSEQNYLRRFHPLIPRVVANGTEPLNQDGSFSFTFLPVDEKWKENEDIAHPFYISATMVDENGNRYSAQKTFYIGAVSVYANPGFEKYNFYADALKPIRIVRLDPDGKPKAGKGTWKIFALKAPSKTLLPADRPFIFSQLFEEQNLYYTPGDLERERWSVYPFGFNDAMDMRRWEESAIKGAGAILHDEKGEGSVSVPPLDPGVYRLIYETRDDFGTKYERRFEFLVDAASVGLPFPAILSIENAPAVGEKARIWVQSGFNNQHMFLHIYRDGKIIRREEIIAGKRPSLVEIPITEEERGGLELILTVLRDNQLMRYFGSVHVRQDDKKLKVEFPSFQNPLPSGGNERWALKVMDSAKNDAAVPAAEALAFVADGWQQPVNPLWLYRVDRNLDYVKVLRANVAQVHGFLLGSNGLNSESVPPSYNADLLATRGEPPSSYSFYHEMSPIDDEALDFSALALVNPQRDVEPAALWLPHLMTGPDGSAAFDFTVPAGAGSWRICAIAITHDFKSGLGCRDVQTK